MSDEKNYGDKISNPITDDQLRAIQEAVREKTGYYEKGMKLTFREASPDDAEHGNASRMVPPPTKDGRPR